MMKRTVQLWAQLFTFPDGDRLTRDEDYPFYDNEGDGEDAFAEFVDAELLKWVGKHKDFGIKEYGWKYLSP